MFVPALERQFTPAHSVRLLSVFNVTDFGGEMVRHSVLVMALGPEVVVDLTADVLRRGQELGARRRLRDQRARRLGRARRRARRTSSSVVVTEEAVVVVDGRVRG